MLCQNCQERDAKVHVSKIIGGQKEDIYLCEECAKMNIDLDFGLDFSFNNLLTGLLNDQLKSPQKINLNNDQLQCGFCGLSYHEFSKSGRLGCNQCYNYFDDKIDKVLRKIHGTDIHTGKIPRRSGEKVKAKLKIKELKKSMDLAVAKEDFERAAELRDEIKKIKSDIRE